MPDVPVWRGPVTLQVPGLPQPLAVQVHGRHDRVISETLLRDGCWEPLETQVMLSLLRPGDTVLDVGANLGYFSVLAAAAVGASGRVLACEPEAANRALLAANIARNGFTERVILHPVALGDHEGECVLYLSADNAGDHGFVASGGREQQTVTVTRGDRLFATEDRLRLIKVDVQGSEPAVLAGLAGIIGRSWPALAILLEFSPNAMDRIAPGSGEALLAQLASWQQPVYVMDHGRNALVETTTAYLADWLQACREYPEDEGFFNLLVGQAPAGMACLQACGC